jgi:hypothetical protein
MDCKAFRNEIEELETGASLSATAQTHVDSCVACRTFQRERLSLRRLVGSLGTVNAPPDFDFRLRARLATARSAGNGSFRRTRFAPSLKAISVAASFVLLVAAAIAFKQFQPGPLNAPAAYGNSTIATTSNAQTQQTKNASLQLTVAQSDKPSAEDSKPPASTKGAASPAGVSNKNITATAQRNAAPVMKDRAPGFVTESAFGGNPPVITRGKSNAANSLDDKYTVGLLQVPSQPVRVLLQDKQGTTRSVSLKPVIFGAQDFLEQNAQRNAPAVDVEGIW